MGRVAARYPKEANRATSPLSLNSHSLGWKEEPRPLEGHVCWIKVRINER